MTKILVTNALPYVNNIPHLGNIMCVLSGDVLAKYYKQFTNKQVLYVCGSDEYGTCTEIKAKQEGQSCQEICDKYHEIHRQIYEWFNVDFSFYGRTTGPTHQEISQEIFTSLYEDGFLFEKETEQYYSGHNSI